MRPYGKIFGAIWRSEDFRALSEDGRALVLYLLSCEHGSIAGVFRLPDGYACEDLQWDDLTRVRNALTEVERAGFAVRCERTKWVWVIKHLEWNRPENPNQRTAAREMFAEVPHTCEWRARFVAACGAAIGLEPDPVNPLPAQEKNPSETLSEPFRKGSLTSNSSSNSNSNSKDNPPARARETTIPDDLSVESFRQWAQAQGITGLEAHFDAFVKKCRTAGYTYSNWERATKTAIVDSWSKANTRAPPAQLSAATPDFSGRSEKKTRKKIEVTADGRIL
jgi:hypothetical protein